MTRAQSEVVASILLVAMVVVAVSVVGYYLLGDIGADGGPTADFEGRVTADAVTVTHRGGDAVAGDDLTVVLRDDGTETRYDFASDGSYGPDATFDPGETWRLDGSVPYDPGDRVELVVVHDPSGAVLVRGRQVAVTATPTPTPAPAAALSPSQARSTNDVPVIDKPI